MTAIIAPARNTRAPETNIASSEITCPLFAAETRQLVGYLREYSPWQLESLLDVPPERALSLYDDYRRFDVVRAGSGDAAGDTWPALLSYYGAAYRNMAPQTFDAGQLDFAQGHLRILSALYGMLRPLDGILNHRLGLKKDFSPGGQNLHAFWGDKLYKALYAGDDLILNLASVEYAKLITPHMRGGDRMIACRFLVQKPGGAVGATVSTVRAARGLMTRFFIENGIDDPEGLKEFDADGYEFAPLRSGAGELVFVRRRGGFDV